jgi:NAD(P)-dependent dehydrogenase (short-subunit alcohol dehydrogenase family)
MAGKTTIVTGASSGIGRAIALLFSAEGANVVIADVTPHPREGGKSTEELANKFGGTAIFRRTDVSHWVDVDAAVTETVERFGRLDVMVNNAAIALGESLLATTEADWQKVMTVNLTGVFFGCKRAVQQMLRQDIVSEARGRIVNISSQHGMISAPEDFAYGVSKSGVVYMTRQVAADYAKQHIICNAVAPGKILTGKTGPAMEPRWLEYSESRTPMPRLGKPEDVANAALFLASEEATFVTGINLMVDGGWMAS